jgi:hypothetical protein
LEITKSNVEGKMKKIENLELKLITLREEEKKKQEKTKSCTHNSIKRGQNTKVGGNQGAFCFKLIHHFKEGY